MLTATATDTSLRLMCRHCGRNVGSRVARGLCWGCSNKRGVRELYETAAKSYQDTYRHAALPPAATDARPGTAAKVAVMQRRAMARRQLFHPDDAR